ncbi:TraB/GumN family protein [Sinimarinibacterium thermocellulolyticum]|uniref:TraB/GumN family protein n=1 Tax=Sinimarinibacterium thermocellulolyticum TaxID=3170016 RepID=A0ABV2ACB5_9GAMM
MRRAAWALLALCGSYAAQAQSPAPFAWQVRVAGAPVTHHLVGSIHLLPPSAHPLPAGLERAYAASRRLVLESDLAALSSPAVQAQMLAAGSATSADGIAGEIPAALHARLRSRLERQSLQATLCDALRAWLCALTLELGAYQRAGFLPDLGIDQHFHARARADGRAVVWLEALEQQVALFTQMPDRLGVDFLVAALDGVDDPALSPRALLEAWRKGDVAHLHAQVERLRREHPLVYARLLAERNAAWLEPLEGWLRDGTPTLVVVGAAHLVGSDGLVAGLRERGFELRAGVSR